MIWGNGWGADWAILSLPHCWTPLHCSSLHRFILSSFCRWVIPLPMAHTMVGTVACAHSKANPSHWVQSLMDTPTLMVIMGIRNLQKGRIAYAAPRMVGPLMSSRSIKSPFKTSQQVCAQHCMFIVVIIFFHQYPCYLYDYYYNHY